jgi:hypothetical protein
MCIKYEIQRLYTYVVGQVFVGDTFNNGHVNQISNHIDIFGIYVVVDLYEDEDDILKVIGIHIDNQSKDASKKFEKLEYLNLSAEEILSLKSECDTEEKLKDFFEKVQYHVCEITYNHFASCRLLVQDAMDLENNSKKRQISHLESTNTELVLKISRPFVVSNEVACCCGCGLDASKSLHTCSLSNKRAMGMCLPEGKFFDICNGCTNKTHYLDTSDHTEKRKYNSISNI